MVFSYWKDTPFPYPASSISTLFYISASTKVVQERLGHSTITTTLDIYSHVSPGMQQAAAIRFDGLMGNKPDKIISTVNVTD
jgi:integrase